MEESGYLTFTNPATGENFGRVKMTTPGEIQEHMQAMRTAFPAWSGKSVQERVRILGQLQGAIFDHLDEITTVLTHDTGKSRQDALIEVMMTIDLLQQYRSHAPSWLRRQTVSSGLYFFKTCYVEPRPYGVTLVISPWNYPFYLSMPPVIAALLAGNTVLLKPSEITGACGVMMEKLMQGIPELAPFVRVIHGDGPVGAAVVQAAPDNIFLTGSTATGRKVMQSAAPNLIPVACELGGKDAVIVLEDADLQAAAHWIVWGAFFNTGQTCMAVERVYVVEQVYDEFVRRTVAETQALKVGYSEEKDSPYYLGPMTDPRQVKIIERHMEDGLAKGARILTGGQQRGMFIDPIVVVDVNHDMQMMCEETFGPVLPIMKVKDEAEAVRLANDSDFGLGASVWSNDINRAVRVTRQVRAGTALVNDTIAQIAIPMLPFGGMKASGNGRIHGREGLLQFTQTFAYAVGSVPKPVDLAVMLRKPGNYNLGASLWRILFGTNLHQRWEGLRGLLGGKPRIPQPGSSPTIQPDFGEPVKAK